MNNCSHCGGLLRHEPARHVCTVCGKSFYDNPKAAVAILLYTADRQKIIFAVRKHDPHENAVDCMGGFLDIGENYEEAAFRELKEEFGLTKDDLLGMEYLASCYDDYPWESTTVPVASVYFIAQLKAGAIPVASDDVGSITEIEITDINYEDFAWDGMREVVRVAIQRLTAM